MNSWARSACYPRGTFYPLSDAASTSMRRITSSDFRPCSTCQSHSQAPLCTCTRHLSANPAEPTIALLRDSLGGYRPSKTDRLPLSSARIHGTGVRCSNSQGWCLIGDSATPERAASKSPTYAEHENRNNSDRLQLRCIGSFRPSTGRRHLHRQYNFTERPVETAPNSLHDSCRSELTRQGISLP